MGIPCSSTGWLGDVTTRANKQAVGGAQGFHWQLNSCH
jgi:hypothetical protein